MAILPTFVVPGYLEEADIKTRSLDAAWHRVDLILAGWQEYNGSCR